MIRSMCNQLLPEVLRILFYVYYVSSTATVVFTRYLFLFGRQGIFNITYFYVKVAATTSNLYPVTKC